MVSKKKKPITGIKPADKPGIALLALKRPDRPTAIAEEPVKDEVISLPATEDTVITKPAHDIKTQNSNGSSPVVDSVPKSNDSETKSNADPLIGTFIEVLAPWGKKVLVKIVDTYVVQSGDKWVRFNAIDVIPDGWMWQGGVKLISV